MAAEDWLNSSITLCELMVVSDNDMNMANSKVTREDECAKQPCSSAASNNQSSIFCLLDMYAHTIDKVLRREESAHDVPQQALYASEMQQVKENFVFTTAATAAVVCDFAQALADDIIKAATYRHRGNSGNMEEKDDMSPVTCHGSVGGLGHGSSDSGASQHCVFDPNANVLWRDDQECKVVDDRRQCGNEMSLAGHVASSILRAALREAAQPGRDEHGHAYQASSIIQAALNEATIPVREDQPHSHAADQASAIIQAALREAIKPGGDDEHGHADEASAIIQAALKEVTKPSGGSPQSTARGSVSVCSAAVSSANEEERGHTGQIAIHGVQHNAQPPSDDQVLPEHMDMQESSDVEDMDVSSDNESAFTPASSRGSCEASAGASKPTAAGGLLSQASLASNQSLDYPDAPPSTPLVSTGVTQSRASFCRKLKGGLAKEFLPDPPPPTPNKKQNASHHQQLSDCCDDGNVAGNTAKFVEHLMRSLSLCERSDGTDAAVDTDSRKSRGGYQELFGYAQQLSADIVKRATTTTTTTSGDGREEGFVDRLMWSLSLECADDTLVEVMEDGWRPRQKTAGEVALDGFADHLASELICCASRNYALLSQRRRLHKAARDSVFSFAEHFVDEILEDTYGEVIDRAMRIVSEVNPAASLTNQQGSESETSPDTEEMEGSRNSSQFQDNEPTPTSPQSPTTNQSAWSQEEEQQENGGLETAAAGLRELADELLVTALAQALTELQESVLYPVSGTGPVSPPGPPPSSSSSSSSLSHKTSSTLGTSTHGASSSSSSSPHSRHGNTEHSNQAANGRMSRPDYVTSRRAVVDCFAEHLAMEVIDVSAKVASKRRHDDGKTRRPRYMNGSQHRDEGEEDDEDEDEEGEATQRRRRGPVARAALGTHMCSTSNQLKGALLWAAASQQGVRTLALSTADSQLQTQFRGVAQASQLAGWTVGGLVRSLLQHCTHLCHSSSRGSSHSELHPLAYLQELAGVSP
ncbi:uncharacterized protein si:dkey-171c9.3 [Engraulis encrasicolus]|uniref:uncharacterized protein si:dkey-171c9.3 n=1 Tax=Engraulis encrasicolus TaxID=184585 RepID=UPI002FD4AFB0